jgi:phosphoribosylamine---glycine ligase
MKILILGNGGREHALAWRIAQCEDVSQMHVAPGNPGIEALTLASGGPVQCHAIPLSEEDSLIATARAKQIDLVVIGPEAPLADGLADRFRARGMAVFGPLAAVARLEASKAHSKAFMDACHIPTARYGYFTDRAPAFAFLETLQAPYVIKASGLAGGKGVIIAHALEAAQTTIDEMLGGQIGEAGKELVIEEYMAGEEASIFVVTDGVDYVILPPVQDHKKVGEGDTGPNTGGMGAYGPAPVVTPILMDQIRLRIIEPTLAGLQARGTPYCGVLFIGVMLTRSGPKVVEYNVRFGDPECQVLMRLMTNRFAHGLMSAAEGRLDKSAFASNPAVQHAVCVTYAAKGYPGASEKGTQVRGVAIAETQPGVVVFHAGTARDPGGQLIANGGRVLSVTATGDSVPDAISRAYAGVEAIDWPEGFYRRDIGHRELARLARS